MKRIVILAAFVAMVFGSTPVIAGQRPPMHLTYWDYAENYDIQNYGAINGCMDEDDKDRRSYAGYLGPGESFTADPTIFCETYLTDGVSDGNTGAYLSLIGDTNYRLDWTRTYWQLCTPRFNPCPASAWQVTVPEGPPYLIYSREKGRPSEWWKGCQVETPGVVSLTITNVGSRVTYTTLETGTRWHDLYGDFYWDCGVPI